MHEDSEIVERFSLKTSEELFQDIPNRKPRSEECEVAGLNRDKNRYADAIPNDLYRFKLNKECGDYVNISKVCCGQDRWVLCGQGPTSRTAYDFWRAVIEAGSELVIMLTRTQEKGRDKCSQYIPLNNEPLKFECLDCMVDKPIKVFLESQAISDDCSFRTSNVRLVYGLISHEVIHVQYLKWDDFHIPDPLEFRIVVGLAEKYKLPLIHCSAGLGRTGTLIAALRRKITGETAEEAITQIRKYRGGLVATVDQYRVVKNF